MFRNRKKTAGFSLIELIIAIVILGIITAIAVPSYLSHINNERLRYAKTRLTVMALAIEAQHAEKGTYKNMKLSDIDFSSTDEEGNTYTLSKLNKDNFLLSVTIPNNETCHTLTINVFNQRHAYSKENADTKVDCW
ncbi:prepilin-type N-terminal cleavage/methylation domain-containing protein [Francisellaceae bacterium]|nr:prepilin-type N-terminal cleavage/methylation domain-containing protein [Francisellaceae bacterium]